MKTLANLEAVASDWDSVTDLCISTKQLKAAAVEWVKELRKRDYFTMPDGPRTNIFFNKGEIDATVFWITHFFNPTEEDLGEKT